MHPLQNEVSVLNHAVHGGLADMDFGDLHAEHKYTKRHGRSKPKQAKLTSVIAMVQQHLLQGYTDSP